MTECGQTDFARSGTQALTANFLSLRAELSLRYKNQKPASILDGGTLNETIHILAG